MMKKILLTGAFGNVGLSTLNELISRGYNVRAFEVNNRRNHKLARKYEDKVEIIWGDLRNKADVETAVAGCEIVIHLAAIIPPLADKQPKFARSVNVGGTANLISAMQKQPLHPRIIYTSSISVYGDRLKNPYIRVTDPPNPNDDDEYAKQKLEAEDLIRKSGLKFAIFRLSYITSLDKLQMDPLLFHMPLDTHIEICDTKDVGLALANAVETEEIWGETFHIAGGEHCQTTFREYLNRMMEIFGLGRMFLPEEAFSKGKFHCGWMDTERSQALLKYQRCTLEEYYSNASRRVGVKRVFNKMVKTFARIYLLSQSPFYKSEGKKFINMPSLKRFFEDF